MIDARRLLLLLLLPLLGGPTPGAVGSCSGDDLDAFADIEEYCTQREELICVRKWRRNELTEEQRDDCRREMIALCSQRFWPRDCRPTERQTRACLNALRSVDTLDMDVEDIDECNTSALCTVRTVEENGEENGGEDGEENPDGGSS